jgi:hypothetical protein
MSERSSVPRGVDPDLMNYVREASRNTVQRDQKSGRFVTIKEASRRAGESIRLKRSDSGGGGRKKG